MGIKIKTQKNRFPKMKAAVRAVDGKKVVVGVTGEQAWLAAIHEYGCDIRPVNAKYLTVPCNKKARGRRAGEFHDLFFLQLDDGSKWLVRDKGSDQLEFMYALMKHVKIPERSFLRSGFDACHMNAVRKAEQVLPKVMEGKKRDRYLYEIVGTLLRDGIKDYAVDLNSPPKSPLTIAANGGKSNPLVDTGDMINAIEYTVEG